VIKITDLERCRVVIDKDEKQIKQLQAENRYMKELLEIYGGCNVCKHQTGIHSCELGSCKGWSSESKWELRLDI